MKWMSTLQEKIKKVVESLSHIIKKFFVCGLGSLFACLPCLPAGKRRQGLGSKG
jgi:hypothetical protein